MTGILRICHPLLSIDRKASGRVAEKLSQPKTRPKTKRSFGCPPGRRAPGFSAAIGSLLFCLLPACGQGIIYTPTASTRCEPESCFGHGICDDSSGEALCTCNDRYAGARCDRCTAGFQDNDSDGLCQEDCSSLATNCGKNGSCNDDSGTAVCKCQEGYLGDSCESCAPGFHDDDGSGSCTADSDCLESTCSLRGTCTDSSGSVRCACDPGYSGDRCAACSLGFQDHDSDGTCEADCISAFPNCGSHGSCEDTTGTAACACSTGYTGALCDECALGFHEDGNGACAPDQVDPDYSIRAVIFLANDTNIDVDSYCAQVNSSFAMVRNWYSQQLGGKTFDLQDAIVFRSTLTTSQVSAQYGDGCGLWLQGLKEAVASVGDDVCDYQRFYYFVSPLENTCGGMLGSEWFGCSYVLPGTAAIPGHMGRLVGGIVDPNWPEWFADETRESQGGVAHEIAHGIGGICRGANVPGNCDAMPHATPGGNSIMFEWWQFGINARVLAAEKTQILKSPFIH